MPSDEQRLGRMARTGEPVDDLFGGGANIPELTLS
jgi:hypothetical protein